MRRLIVILMVVSGLLTVAPTPAAADHTWGFGHWERTWSSGYPAPPIDDRNNTWRNGQQVFRNAAAYWRDVSGWRYHPWLRHQGGSAFDCTPTNWAIVVCAADMGRNYTLGNATGYWFGNQGHFIACVIRLNVNYAGGWSDDALYRWAYHETGHCGGLGHTGYNPSVMQAIPPTWQAHKHDQDSLLSIYDGHIH